jgi:hypothetical protein
MAKAPKPAPQEPEQKPQASGGSLNLEQTCRLLMLSKARVQQLVKGGYIPKPAKDTYPIIGAVQGYIKFLKEEERRTSKVQADSRVRDARAREIELRIAEREHDLIPIEDAKAEISAFTQDTRAEITGLGARITRDMELRRQIDTEVDQILHRLAERAEKAGHALATEGDAFEAIAEDMA